VTTNVYNAIALFGAVVAAAAAAFAIGTAAREKRERRNAEPAQLRESAGSEKAAAVALGAFRDVPLSVIAENQRLAESVRAALRGRAAEPDT
jgi:hypothetical protein